MSKVQIDCSVPGCCWVSPEVPDWNIVIKLLEAHNFSNHPQPAAQDNNEKKDISNKNSIPEPDLPDLTTFLPNYIELLDDSASAQPLKVDEYMVKVVPAVNDVVVADRAPVEVVPIPSTSSDYQDSRSSAEKTINEDPTWFESLRNNFEAIVISKLDVVTRDAFGKNLSFEDEKAKKRIAWPIMKSITEHLFLKFGGFYPKIHTFDKVASELGRKSFLNVLIDQ